MAVNSYLIHSPGGIIVVDGQLTVADADAVRGAIKRSGQVPVAMVNQVGDSAQLREWVRCLVIPYTETLAARRPPTWYARLNAQIMADPVLRNIQLEEAVSASLQQVIRGLEVSTPERPAPVLRERELMAGHILIQTCAYFERGLADAPPSGKTWRKVGSGLVDALVGLWSAPVSR